MILVDYSRLSIAGVISQVGMKGSVEKDLARHFILNMVQLINRTHREEFGQLVIACDSKKYWRRDVFPYYKAHRKKAREQSEFDWKSLFEATGSVKEELKEFFPYNVIEVEGAEADDIIGTLCHEYGQEMAFGSEKILIIASDGDFNQLLKYANVFQYDPHKKKMVTDNNPEMSLIEKIIGGDPGDGIPNIRSDDDAIINPDKRQKPINAKIRQDVVSRFSKNDLGEYERNWRRNATLIDLSIIPPSIVDNILEVYEKGPNVKDRSKLMDYFSQHRLRNLIDHVSNF